jgi:hypothetical protein
LLLFFPGISFGQESPDPPLNHAQSERKPFFSDVTIWTAQTVGSVNVMSTYPGQEMFAAGIGLRRHLFNFRHTMVRWNFEVIPVCMPSFPGANGRTYHYGGGGGLGLDFEPRRKWRGAVYRRELWPAGIYDPTASGHAKNELLTAIRPGIGVPAAGEKSLRTGITFFHFSNMHTVKNNPGFDGILIYMGYSFSFEHKRSGQS